jgi:nucleoside-diphosphate-sugar epimerase
MNVLVLGATGATGKLATQILLEEYHHVTAIIRPKSQLDDSLMNHSNMTVVRDNIDSLSEEQLCAYLEKCDAVVSCLGHNLSCKGLFGHPRDLVSGTVEKVKRCAKMLDRDTPLKLVLMSSSGVANQSIDSPMSFASRCVVGTLRALLPPHADNERAAATLQQEQIDSLEWVTVRPDSLVNCSTVSPFDVHTSPQRDPIFNAGDTSRINVAKFMVDLLMSPSLWRQWRSQTPVIYNRSLQQ